MIPDPINRVTPEDGTIEDVLRQRIVDVFRNEDGTFTVMECADRVYYRVLTKQQMLDWAGKLAKLGMS